jgi:hypothetical protein
MKAKVSIFSDKKQTVTVDEKGVKFLSKEAKEKYSGKVQKETSIAERTLFVAEHEVKGNLPLGKKLAILEHFATRVVGARVAALMSADKRFPSRVFFRIEMNGRVYSSKTALTKADLVSTIAVNLKKLVNDDGSHKSDIEIINIVGDQQKKGVRAAITFLHNLTAIAKEADKIAESFEGASHLVVDGAGKIEQVETVVVVPDAVSVVPDMVGEN